MRQRGFGSMDLLIIAGAVLAIAAVVYGIYHKGYAAGSAEKQTEWDAANRKAEAEAKERRVAVDAAIAAANMEALEAEEAARQANNKWREARRAANRNRVPLAVCQPESRPSGGGVESGSSGGRGIALPATPAAGDPAGGIRLRLSWRFVGLHDGAYSGADGKPIFSAQAEFAAAPERADTPSPYGLDDLIDVIGDNAFAHSACVRDLNALMDRIDAAYRAWGSNK